MYFAPGPNKIPKIVIKNINNVIKNKNPFEISHRSIDFIDLLLNLNSKIKTFLKINNDFEILWTHGGATSQFTCVPLNIKPNESLYCISGSWSNESYIESKKITNPDKTSIYNLKYKLKKKKYDYLYICSNETADGIEFKNKGLMLPNRSILNSTKLIVDMSSDLTMKKVDWNNIDVAFASTSKNLGLAGSCITIVRKNLIEKHNIPKVLNWYEYLISNSLLNTINIFNIYLINEMFDYYITNYTIDDLEHLSLEKSKLLYDFLDNNNLITPLVTNNHIRSNINIPLCVINKNHFNTYLYINGIHGLDIYSPYNTNLRVSLYNSITVEETKYLINIMDRYSLTL